MKEEVGLIEQIFHQFIPICRERERRRRGLKLKKKNPVFTLSVSERIIKVASSRGRQTELV